MDDIRYNPEIIRINLSTPFPIRSRCKHCMNGPRFYYSLKIATRWFDPRKSLNQTDLIKRFLKRMSYDYYLSDDPSSFINMSAFKHIVKYKGFYPTLHHKSGIQLIEDYTEFLACSCGRTSWGFSQKSNRNRPEISRRKARYTYPCKFQEWY